MGGDGLSANRAQLSPRQKAWREEWYCNDRANSQNRQPNPSNRQFDRECGYIYE
jgi:hypothetical protein